MSGLNTEEIIQLAREAGWQYANGDDGYEPLWKFGELVAAAEREKCVKELKIHGWGYASKTLSARGQE
jgi:hypothetical protein